VGKASWFSHLSRKTHTLNKTNWVKEFHRACFCCAECGCQLESVYGSAGGEFYCERCYIQRAGKRCAGCNQVILGPGLRFGEENYHTSCFKCTVCGAGLEGGTGVHAVDGRPACMECYEAQFQERCAVCGEQVAEGLKFRGARFHTACFTCSTCGLELGQRKGEFILTEGQQLQCKICVKTTRSADLAADSACENCTACELPVHVKNLVYDGERNWHHKCFVCSQCRGSLVSQKYYDKESFLNIHKPVKSKVKILFFKASYWFIDMCDGCWQGGSLYCRNCFLAEHLPTCYQCGLQLAEGGVKMSSESGQVLTWHQACLACSVCQANIKLDNVVFKEKLFCKTCYLDAILNKCEQCCKPIAGVGFTFRGKFWHDTCFACDACQAVFADGKFRNLREQKLCDECFKPSTQIR